MSRTLAAMLTTADEILRSFHKLRVAMDKELEILHEELKQLRAQLERLEGVPPERVNRDAPTEDTCDGRERATSRAC
jgi:hypothetical protein